MADSNVVTPARFERAAYRLGICCSILLSYGAIGVGIVDLVAVLKLYVALCRCGGGGSVGVIRFAVVFLSGLLLIACGDNDPLGALERGERGRVVRVIDGDALVLETGQSVRLIGIEAPARPYREREGQTFHKEAKRMLEDMALGRHVELCYAGRTRDRYDRALAHVVTDDALGASLWLNLEMAQRGGGALACLSRYGRR